MRLISAERSERKYAFAGTSAKIACSACVDPKHTLVSHSIRCTATHQAESQRSRALQSRPIGSIRLQADGRAWRCVASSMQCSDFSPNIAEKLGSSGASARALGEVTARRRQRSHAVGMLHPPSGRSRAHAIILNVYLAPGMSPVTAETPPHSHDVCELSKGVEPQSKPDCGSAKIRVSQLRMRRHANRAAATGVYL